jgi:coenzyme F420-reducing hydrogenase gamma subunit
MPEKNNNDKIRLGWFSFSCCEDNTIIMTEIMNDHWEEWKQQFDFVHARVLQAKNQMGPMDIAFIEGAIARSEQEAELKIIRQNSILLVAVGSCAVTGMPSAQRNLFPEETKHEITDIVERFGHLEKVLKVSEVVKVDAEIPGCPMDPAKFLEVVNSAVAQIKNMRGENQS